MTATPAIIQAGAAAGSNEMVRAADHLKDEQTLGRGFAGLVVALAAYVLMSAAFPGERRSPLREPS